MKMDFHWLWRVKSEDKEFLLYKRQLNYEYEIIAMNKSFWLSLSAVASAVRQADLWVQVACTNNSTSTPPTDRPTDHPSDHPKQS